MSFAKNDQFAENIIQYDDQHSNDCLCPEALDAEKSLADAQTEQQGRQKNLEKSGKDSGADKKEKFPEQRRQSMCFGMENEKTVGNVCKKDGGKPGNRIAYNHGIRGCEGQHSIDNPVDDGCSNAPEKIGNGFVFKQLFNFCDQ